MKRILYIEDTVPTAYVVQKHLTGLAEISLASDLAEGRKLLRKDTFDLLLCDVYLPDGTGLELVFELRKTLSPAQLPVILVSSSMDQLLRAKSFRVGANDCFPMPTPWPVLVGAVGRMLKQPYIGLSESDGVAVTWTEGMAGDQFWLFCPELNLSLQGQSLETLRETMTERVRSAVAGGKRLPFVRGVRTTEPLVKVPGSAAH